MRGGRECLQRLLGGLAGPGSSRPGCDAMGDPSRGEMGRLLTREIKSSRDGEYLCAHLRTPREDASSRAAAAKSHSSRLLSREPFVCTAGKTIWAPPGHSPQGRHCPGSPLPAGPKRLPPSPTGVGGGAGNLPAAAPTAGHLSRLKREEQNLTFSSLGLISSAKPPFGAVDGHGWPGQRPLPSWGASSGQV